MGLRVKLISAFVLTVVVTTVFTVVFSLRFEAAIILRHLGMAGLDLGAYPFHLSQAVRELNSSNHQLLSSLRVGLLRGGGFGLVFGAIASVFVSSRLLAPIRRLTNAAERLRGGHWQTRVDVRGTDELSQLGHAFNELAAELDHADQMRHNLVADVAHELRTPLSGIQAYLEALQDGIIEMDASSMTRLSQEFGRLTRLVADLEQLTRIDSGGVELELEPVDVNALVKTVLSVRQPDLDDHKVSVVLSLAELPKVTGDDDRLMQIIHNLVANAIAHVPDGGGLRISTGRENGWVAIGVANEGPEIPEDELNQLFERFFRSDRSRSRATGAAGLGLTISRKLSELHGGKLLVNNIEGWGVSFELKLPLDAM